MTVDLIDDGHEFQDFLKVLTRILLERVHIPTCLRVVLVKDLTLQLYQLVL
jgi:hypothetical protein